MLWDKHRRQATSGISRALAQIATLSCAAAMAAMFMPFESAVAESYPSRPITIMVPYTAGGPSDTLARILAERMRVSLGEPVIIDNVGGASGRIGVGRVARAAPDGYTLIAGSSSTYVMNPAIYALNYDVVKDFEPVSLIANTPQLIVVRKTMPANDLKELIAWLKSNPDKVSQGTTGVGGTSHLAGVLFQKETGTHFQFVPYRGTAIQDLIAGHVDLMIDQASNALPHVQSGAIKAYAVAAGQRLPEAPDIPSVDEAGLPGFHISVWSAFFAPKGTSKNVIAQLNTAVVDTLADPVVRARLADIGQQIFPREQQTPEALAAFHRAEIDKWWPIIKGAKIQAE
jgi:tripartite-type tricarboxylate transporter receptor subunit TctC